MNIIISPFEKETYYFRSDSTFIRAISDYYIPDYVKELSLVPVLVFRIDRAGKAVRSKFAMRYFGPFNYGILLKFVIDEKFDSYREFIGNSMDYSTIVPKELNALENFVSFLDNDRPLTITINGLEKFRMEQNPSLSSLYGKFSLITDFCSVRTGDFLAYELSDPIPLKKGYHILEHNGVTNTVDLLIN